MTGRTEQAAEPEWMRCEHHWVYTSQPDMPIVVGQCSQCGYYNGPDLQEQIDKRLARLRAVVAAVRDEVPSIKEWLAEFDVTADVIARSFAKIDAALGAAVTQPEIVHMVPPAGSGLMPCCGQSPLDPLTITERMTADPALVTCSGTPTPEATTEQR